MKTTPSIRFAVGHCDDIDTEDAVRTAAEACIAKLGDMPDAVIVFASIEYDPTEVVNGLKTSLPGSLVVGCSGDGEMSSGLGLCEDSVAMLAFGGGALEFGSGMADDYGVDSFAATGRAIDAAMAGHDSPPDAAFVFPSGLHGNTSEALRAFQERFGYDFPVFGGTSGDHWELQRCWSFGGNRWAADAIPVLLVWGPLNVGVGVESGWTRIGVPMTVTRAEGNIVYEIDGAPAIQAFEAQFGQRVEESIGELPLAVLTEGDKESYLRAAYHVDPEQGSLRMGAEIPVGARVSLTNSTKDRILEGAQLSTEQALAQLPSPPGAILVISCAARKWLLGHAVTEEIDLIRKSMGRAGIDVPIVGFYSFGEIGPLGGASRFHNETCVVLPLGVKAA